MRPSFNMSKAQAYWVFQVLHANRGKIRMMHRERIEYYDLSAADKK